LPKTTIANDTITLVDNTDYYNLNLTSEDTIDFDSSLERVIYLKNNSSIEKWSFNCDNWGSVKIDLGNDSILTGGWEIPYDQSNFIFARVKDRGPSISLILEKGKIYLIKISLTSPVLNGNLNYYNCGLVPSSTVGGLNSFHTMITCGLILILILFAIYNFLLFFVTKDKIFIKYSLTHLFFSLLWLNSMGVTLYLFEFDLSFLRLLDSIFSTVFMGFYYWFTRGFLDTKKIDIKVDILLKYFQYVLFIISILFLLLALLQVSYLDYILSHLIVNVLSPLGVIFLVIAIIRAILRKDRLTIYFSLVMLTFVLIVILMNFNDRNISSDNIFVYNAVLFGAVLEAIFFSLGLAAKIKIAQTEKVIAQKELIDKHIENQKIKEQFNKELEKKVEVRTLELQQKNKYIELALKEKEILIKEVHHRVKNKLQLIYSFMCLQSNRSKSELVKGAISESKERVRVLSMIHNNLSLSENSEEINIKDYIPDIANHLSSLSLQKKMNTICNIDSFLLPIKKAVSLGLIVNEIITNSIKYAEVSSVEKHIYINAIVNQGKIELDIYDDGIKHESSDIEVNSLGTLIIQDLTKQLKAKLEVNEKFRYKIVIPIQ
jgi:two-component sensor histidine kinase